MLNINKMTTIKLYDPETDSTYILEVTEEEAERANDGKSYITYTYVIHIIG